MQAFENFTLALVDHTHSVCAFDNIVATKKFPYQKNIISNVHFAVCVCVCALPANAVPIDTELVGSPWCKLQPVPPTPPPTPTLTAFLVACLQ